MVELRKTLSNKKLPLISGLDLIKYLYKKGFKITKTRGDHVYMKLGDRETQVPFHKTLKKGTLLGRLSDCGISKEQFVMDVKK